jgi:vancomycin resistance protein YoaR
MAGRTQKTRKNQNSRAARTSLYVLGAVAVAVVVFFLGQILLGGGLETIWPTQPSETSATSGTTADVTGTMLQGISIGGVDVSGMTREQALAATASIPAATLARLIISVQVDVSISSFNARELAIGTNYVTAVADALAYGHTGTDAERKSAEEKAKMIGVDFPVKAVASKDAVLAALQPLKEQADLAPVDATVTFMAWGYTADGQAYLPDPKKLADANARGNNLSRPDLVRVSEADKPLAARYLFWSNDHYVKNYIPADASISRFFYTPDQSGRSLDLAGLAEQIIAQAASGSYKTIVAEFDVVEAAVKLADVKRDTQLISSWSSSYRNHATVNRDWNVSRMASFINGAVIQPGDKWSVNKTAGPRDEKTAVTIGWKKAAGILFGGYTDQEGGGVCQLGSTTYNAAKRADLIIVSATHHTIPSDYIPLGLDATLSTPSPDLVLGNGKTKPVYIVSYVNPKDQNVTVEIYGQPVIDPVYGEVIYDFTSDNRGTRYGEPIIRPIYNATAAPDETVLDAANPVYAYAKPRMGSEIQTYKRIYSLDGKELCDPIRDEHHKYPVINGTTYYFGPDPATVTPTPTPTLTPSPTPEPSPSSTVEPPTETTPEP